MKQDKTRSAINETGCTVIIDVFVFFLNNKIICITIATRWLLLASAGYIQC